MSNKIKGIDLDDKNMRFWPLFHHVTNVTSETKKKSATITIAVPQELADYVIKVALGEIDSINAEQFLLTYRLKEE